MLFLQESLLSVCCVPLPPLLLNTAVTEEAVVASMGVAVAVLVAALATTEVAALSADTTAVDTEATTAVGITAAVAHMAVTVPTELVARSEACAAVQTRGIRVREDPGLGRAEAPGTLRPAGIHLHDPATVVWQTIGVDLEDQATLALTLAVGAWMQDLAAGVLRSPTLRLLTVSGMASEAHAAALQQGWPRARD